MKQLWMGLQMTDKDIITNIKDLEEILKQGIKIHDDIIVSKQILQKAREVENEG